MLNVQFLFNYLNGIRIFLQIRIRIRIFSSESRIFGFGFENFLTTNKIRIRIRKFSGLRIRFEIRIRSKKRFVSTLLYNFASETPLLWRSQYFNSTFVVCVTSQSWRSVTSEVMSGVHGKISLIHQSWRFTRLPFRVQRQLWYLHLLPFLKN